MTKTKTITTGELQHIAEVFFGNWEGEKQRINLPAYALYNLLGLRKKIEEKARVLQDTVSMMAEQCGGILQEQGGYQIPEDKRAELNEKLMVFSREPVEIEYTPVKVGENDYIPVDLMDAIYDFIEMVDN